MNFLAERLRLARVKARLKGKDIAERAGISAGYYSEIENGKKPLSEDLAEKFAGILQVPVSLFAGTVSAPTSPRSAMREARLAKRLSFADLAKLTKYKADVLQAVEEGNGQASERMIEAVAGALQLDPQILLEGSDDPVIREPMHGTYGATPPLNLPPDMGRPRYVPLISMAQAGTMTELNFSDGGYTREGVTAIDVKDHRAFGVTVRGDSMVPNLAEGDVAIVYPSWIPRQGDVVLCRLTDEAGGDVMIKVFSARESGSRVVLTSYNPAYPPLEFPRRDFVWIYPVVTVTKTLRR